VTTPQPVLSFQSKNLKALENLAFSIYNTETALGNVLVVAGTINHYQSPKGSNIAPKTVSRV